MNTENITKEYGRNCRLSPWFGISYCKLLLDEKRKIAVDS